MRLDYIAIIVSSEKCLEFYHKPGFVESKRIARSNDSVVFMKTEDTTLEIFIDSRHPERLERIGSADEAHSRRTMTANQSN